MSIKRFYITSTVALVGLLILVHLMNKPKELKYKYAISSDKGTWFVNEYQKKNDCVSFIYKSKNKELEICSPYTIEKSTR